MTTEKDALRLVELYREIQSLEGFLSMATPTGRAHDGSKITGLALMGGYNATNIVARFAMSPAMTAALHPMLRELIRELKQELAELGGVDERKR